MERRITLAPLDRLARALEEVVRGVGSTEGCVHLVSSDGSRMLCQAVTSGFRATTLAHGLDLSDCPAVREVLDSEVPLGIDEAENDERVAEVARQRYGLRSALYVPVVGARRRGVAVLSHRVPHAWTEAERAAAIEARAGLRAAIDALDATIGEEPLPPREARLRAMIDNLPGTVAIVDRELRVIERASRLGSGRALPPLPALIAGSNREDEVRQAIVDLLGGDRYSWEGVLRHQGEPWVVRLVPVRDPDGGVGGVAVTCLDARAVTEGVVALDTPPASAVTHLAHGLAQDLQTLRAALGERPDLDGVMDRAGAALRVLLATCGVTPAAPGAVRLGGLPGLPRSERARVVSAQVDPDLTRAVLQLATADGRTARPISEDEHGLRLLISEAGSASSLVALAPWLGLQLRQVDGGLEVVLPPARPVVRPRTGGGDGQVLIVEDEPAIAAMLQRVVESAGLSVRVAHSLGAARQGATPSALILDLALPDGFGLDLLDELDPPPAVLVVSGYAPSEVRARLRAEGHGFLAKPFGLAALRSAIAELAARASLLT